MHGSMREIAERATFQSFANCYRREVDPGLSSDRPDRGQQQRCIEWSCPVAAARLRAEIERDSVCGPLRFGKVFICRAQENAWHEIAPLRALYLMVQECYAGLGTARADVLREKEAELLGRLLASYHGIVDSLQQTAGHAGQSFIDCEQGLAFGHWLHPTPKSRQGMTDWQRPVYAPEHHGQFQLVYFVVDAALVLHDSKANVSVPDILATLISAHERPALQPSEMLLPLHPLQAEAVMLDPAVKELAEQGRLRRLGQFGPQFSPTSSVRTVYSAEVPWMLKFSLPVRITNSLRINRMPELRAGVAMARLFARTDFLARHPRFRLIRDPAYVTLAIPGRRESGFEVIFRENPFTTGNEHKGIAIAALTADPPPGTRSRLDVVIRDYADQCGLPAETACRRWFAAYLDCALEPLIRLYDELGIALEAHQQNGLLDVSSGLPTAFYYRDNQGFYLSNAHRARLTRLVPETADIEGLYFDDGEIQKRFGYYLIINQVCSVIARMGQDRLSDEESLILMLRERLNSLAHQLGGVGGDFATEIVRRPTLAAKANLLTRILDIDELEAEDGRVIYVDVPNPVFAGRGAARQGGDRVASR